MDHRRGNRNNGGGRGGGGGGGRMTQRIASNILANRKRRGGGGGNHHQRQPPPPSSSSSSSSSSLRRDSRKGIKGDRWEHDGGGGGGDSRGYSKGARQQTPVAIFVSGFADTTREALESFLQRHTRRHFTCSKFDFEGVGARMVVANFKQAKDLTELNGVKYENDTLQIRILEDSASNPNRFSPEQELIMKQALSQRYDGQHKLLDLSLLHRDLLLTSGGIRVDLNKRSMLHSVFKIIKANIPEVLAINFASNELRSLQGFSQLNSFAPSVAKLSFENNKISDIRDLDILKPIKGLQELIMRGNPAVNKAGISYKHDASRKFPSLQLLDGEKLETIRFAVAPTEAILMVPEELGSFFNGDIKSVVEGFLSLFFDCYDLNRDRLIHAYADTACFSLVALREPARPGGRENLTTDYRYYSRNLYNVDKTSKNEAQAWNNRIRALYQGKDAIVNTLKQLPRTRHVVSDFCVDSWQLDTSAVLMIFVHGTFAEVRGNQESLKSFDRTFFLTHAKENSIEAQNGWPLVIVNDQLHIRSFSGRYHQENKAKASSVAVPVPLLPPPLLPPPPAAANPIDAQKELILRLSSSTGMNYAFSEKCLSDNGWNLEAAMQRYMENKHLLPKEAYMPM